MKRKTVLFTAAALIFALALTGCGSGSAQSKSPYQAAELDENGDIVIQKGDITSTATYINYDAGDITVQLIAVRASDDTVRLAYNTCQVCNPSPKAYFVQQDDVFVCQNCGNRFRTDVVGLDSFGCNPTTVNGVTETGDTITIAKEGLEDSAYKFSNWQGPTE